MFAQFSQHKRRVILAAAIGSGSFTWGVGQPCSVQARGPTVIPSDDGSGYSVTLWPPDGNWQALKLSDLVRSAVDDYGNAIDVDEYGQIVRITSDEPATDPLDDMTILSESALQVRAKRAGSSDGRVYTIHYLISDRFGNVTEAYSRVQVPHDPKTPAIDSGVHACVGPGC